MPNSALLTYAEGPQSLDDSHQDFLHGLGGAQDPDQRQDAILLLDLVLVVEALPREGNHRHACYEMKKQNTVISQKYSFHYETTDCMVTLTQWKIKPSDIFLLIYFFFLF